MGLILAHLLRQSQAVNLLIISVMTEPIAFNVIQIVTFVFLQLNVEPVKAVTICQHLNVLNA
jgi:hypothetical protein